MTKGTFIKKNDTIESVYVAEIVNFRQNFRNLFLRSILYSNNSRGEIIIYKEFYLENESQNTHHK